MDEHEIYTAVRDGTAQWFSENDCPARIENVGGNVFRITIGNQEFQVSVIRSR